MFCPIDNTLLLKNDTGELLRQCGDRSGAFIFFSQMNTNAEVVDAAPFGLLDERDPIQAALRLWGIIRFVARPQ